MSDYSEENEKWVDDLLAQLPTPKPVPEDVSASLDQFLAERVSEMESGSNVTSFTAAKSVSKRGAFTQRYQLMAAAAAVVGILAFVGTQTSFFSNSQSNSSQVAAAPSEVTKTPAETGSVQPVQPSPEDSATAPEPTPTNNAPAEGSSESNTSGKVDPEVSSTEIQVLGSKGGTEYLPSDAPNVQVTSSGMDYATDFDAIINKIAPYGEPGKVNKLNDSQLGCIIKLKLVDRVVAVDSGKYAGAKVFTFFALADDGTTKAYITKIGNSCELVKKISLN